MICDTIEQVIYPLAMNEVAAALLNSKFVNVIFDFFSPVKMAVVEDALGIDALWRSGAQREAILAIPVLLNQHPTPNTVNAVFLKLADFWISSLNDIRVLILSCVIGQCSHYAKHIHDMEEVSRRITSVLTSNDPCARSLTLLMVAALADTVGTYTIYKVCAEITTRDTQMELEACAFAIDHIAQQSKRISPPDVVNEDLLSKVLQIRDERNIFLRLIHLLRNSEFDLNSCLAVSLKF